MRLPFGIVGNRYNTRRIYVASQSYARAGHTGNRMEEKNESTIDIVRNICYHKRRTYVASRYYASSG